MKKQKKSKIDKGKIAQLGEIQRATPPEPEPQQKLEATIRMGKRDEITEKVISEANKE